MVRGDRESGASTPRPQRLAGPSQIASQGLLDGFRAWSRKQQPESARLCDPPHGEAGTTSARPAAVCSRRSARKPGPLCRKRRMTPSRVSRRGRHCRRQRERGASPGSSPPTSACGHTRARDSRWRKRPSPGVASPCPARVARDRKRGHSRCPDAGPAHASRQQRELGTPPAPSRGVRTCGTRRRDMTVAVQSSSKSYEQRRTGLGWSSPAGRT
jgi:hypothetical protein